MRFYSFILLFLMCGFVKPKLVKTKITDNITASVPDTFRPMDALDFTQRYPSVRAPLAAYTNEAREVDFSVNISATQWPDENLEVAAGFFKSGINNLFDKVNFIDEGIREVNGKKFIFFEFESRMNGSKMNETQQTPIIRYTFVQYLVQKDLSLVFSFSCPGRLRSEWSETAHEIMSSIKVKGVPKNSLKK